GGAFVPPSTVGAGADFANADNIEALSIDGALPEISSTVNVRMSCRLPSSNSSKSFDVSPLTAAPFLSRTTTSTRTRLTLLRNVAAGGVCWARTTIAVDVTNTVTKLTRHAASTRRIVLKPEPGIDCHDAHGANRRHLAKRRRVKVRVHGRPLHGVEQVRRVD